MATHPRQQNIENAILVAHLPPSLIMIAEEKIFEFISPQSVICTIFGETGLKMFFKDYNPVRRAISRRFLEIEKIRYFLNLLVTPLTIHGIGPYVKEAQLYCLIRHWGKIYNMYRETKPEQEGNETREETGNYRVILAIPDTEYYVPQEYVMVPGNSVRFVVTLHCRHCLGSGHVWCDCNENKDCYRYIKPRLCASEERRTNSEMHSEITPVRENCTNSLMFTNENNESTHHFDESLSLTQPISNDDAEIKIDIEVNSKSEFFSNHQDEKNLNRTRNQGMQYLSKIVPPNMLFQKKECRDLCQRIIDKTLTDVKEKSKELLDELEGTLPDDLLFNEKDYFQGDELKRKIQKKESGNVTSLKNEPDDKNENYSAILKRIKKDLPQPKIEILRNIDETSSAGASISAAENIESSIQTKPNFPTNVQKETQSCWPVKTRQKMVTISRSLTPGLFIANNKTKQLMPPDVFITFLNHVRRKKHPGVIAREYAKTVHQKANMDLVIFKLREVLALFELGIHCSSKDIIEARVLKDLEQRLMKHKNCETCTR